MYRYLIAACFIRGIFLVTIQWTTHFIPYMYSFLRNLPLMLLFVVTTYQICYLENINSKVDLNIPKAELASSIYNTYVFRTSVVTICCVLFAIVSSAGPLDKELSLLCPLFVSVALLVNIYLITKQLNHLKKSTPLVKNYANLKKLLTKYKVPLKT